MQINRAELEQQMREVALRLQTNESLTRLADLIEEWAECVSQLKDDGDTFEFLETEKAVEAAITASRAFRPRC
jgi:uncharacterized protein YicC (UPF0701 family)